MPRVHLTQQYIDNSLVCPEGKRKIELNDNNQVLGMYVSVSAVSPGIGTYYYSYKDPGGKRRHIKIARTTEVPLKEARRRALALKSEVRAGSDPAAEFREKKSVPTLKAFLQEQYLPWSMKTKKSFASDESICRVRVIPTFGDIRMDRISRKELVDFHIRLLDEGLAPATCNHYIKLLRAAYNKAKLWDVTSKNPAEGIKLFHEDNEINNRMTQDELGRLKKAILEDEHKVAASFFMLLILTGCRRGELSRARWSEVSLEDQIWTISSRSSKNKTSRQVPLTSAALDVLKRLPGRQKNGWLFISSQTGERLTCVKRPWTRIKKKAGLERLRVHDLRHQFASELSSRGVSLYIVGQLLGHKQMSTTARYSHISQSALMSSASLIDEALNGKSDSQPSINP